MRICTIANGVVRFCIAVFSFLFAAARAVRKVPEIDSTSTRKFLRRYAEVSRRSSRLIQILRIFAASQLSITRADSRVRWREARESAGSSVLRLEQDRSDTFLCCSYSDKLGWVLLGGSERVG